MTDTTDPVGPVPPPPPGISLEYPGAGEVRVRAVLPLKSRALLGLPRLLLLLVGVMLIVTAFRQRVFVFFWIFGWPFLRILYGGVERKLLIRERSIELERARWLGGPLSIPRHSIARIEVTRAGWLQLFLPALVAHLSDGRAQPLLVGASTEQIDFVRRGLEQWLEPHE